MSAEKCKEVLEQRAQQFRMIQKRLLTKFKDKTPSPLQNLDTLLEGTFRQVGISSGSRKKECSIRHVLVI